MLIPRKPFDGQDGLCFAGIQCTVARAHGSTRGVDEEEAGKTPKLTLRTQLRRGLVTARSLTGDPNLLMFLIFVTPPNGIARAQKLAKTVQQGDLAFTQFAFWVDWFDGVQILEKFDEAFLQRVAGCEFDQEEDQ